jgi:hypothetical protein
MAKFVRVNLVAKQAPQMEMLLNSEQILWLVPQPDGTTVIQMAHAGNDDVRQLHVYEPAGSIIAQF